MSRFTRQRVALLLILLAGTALRLFRLGADSLWYDETVSTYLAGSPLPELLRHTASDIHPPGYYVMLRAWLLLAGYGDGRADPNSFGLEWTAAFFSLFWGVLLIALVYALARRLLGGRVALIAAALVALSPYNVWYSQEVRMYTLGAALGVLAVLGMVRSVEPGGASPRDGTSPRDGARNARCSRLAHFGGPALYCVSAAAGLYSLYYFVFLLIALNAWALWRAARVRRLRTWVLANLAVLILYVPWMPIAWRQATDPPVPPWRTAPQVAHALAETWQALVLGQSAPPWLWLVAALAAVVFGIGLWFAGRQSRSHGFLLAALTFGPLALILVVSLITPLYHVRYMFTYSPAVYVGLAAGMVALTRWRGRGGRILAFVFATLWLVAAGVTLRAFWADAAFRADDHRAAVRDLRAAWRPGDVVVVNAGWAYTALATYWDGEIAGRSRIIEGLPEARDDGALVMVTTGHVDGAPKLGWGDPRSDFFAMPSAVAEQQVESLFDRFSRVWHYRLYDTVNDPSGMVRDLLEQGGTRVEDRVYGGEAFMRLEAYEPKALAWPQELPIARFGDLVLAWQPIGGGYEQGETVYARAWWRADAPLTTLLATSLRLVAMNGEQWAQPPDENPFSPLNTSVEWQPGSVHTQGLALTIPPGTAPGQYSLVLLPYESGTGAPLRLTAATEAGQPWSGGPTIGRITVTHPDPLPAERPALATFGPLALLRAGSPAETLSPGDALTLDLLWQAREAPGEPYVVVTQLLDDQGAVAASAEFQPLLGNYPTTQWAKGELVRDRHYLTLPEAIPPGRYTLVVGLYRGADGVRELTATGPFTRTDHYSVKPIVLR